MSKNRGPARHPTVPGHVRPSAARRRDACTERIEQVRGHFPGLEQGRQGGYSFGYLGPSVRTQVRDGTRGALAGRVPRVARAAGQDLVEHQITLVRGVLL
jgi:hypothetical protein